MNTWTYRISFLIFLSVPSGIPVMAQSPASPIGIATGAVGATGGKKTLPDLATHVSLRMLPPDVQIYAAAIGSRLTSTGAEQTTMTGTYADKDGTVPMTLVWQNPGKVQVRLQSSKAAILTWDGSAAGIKSSAGVSAVQNDLIETLTDDYPDSFFFNLRTAAYRLLGSRARTDDGQTPGYTGPYYDICEKVGPAPSSKVMNRKLYFFDSTTGLLSLVKYQTASGVPIEVVYSNWIVSNGQRTPGTIERRSAGTVEFTITLGPPALAAANSNSVFDVQ